MSKDSKMNKIVAKCRLAAVIVVACGLGAGCGGSTAARSGLGGAGKPPPPPDLAGIGGKGEERDISSAARSDYMAAIEQFKTREKEGWNSDVCRDTAERFLKVAQDHPTLAEAQYMAGLSYHRCNMAREAERHYQETLKLNKAHAASLSNLGELYFDVGKVDSAKQYWESAVKADAKIVAARINLAWLLLEQMRKASDKATWSKLESEARFNLSSALAVDNDNVKAYVLYGLLYLEGSDRNKSRLDLAKLLLDEGAKRDDNYASLYNARGLLQMHRNNLGEALKNFERAVALDSSFVEARMNVGNITLGFRKYDTAEEQFTKVLELQPDNYDALIGLGIAQRGLGKLSEAEASYKKAISKAEDRSTAYFNLGVLYKDFLANKANDLKASRDAYATARTYFEKYVGTPDATEAGKSEAKDNIADCDKIIKDLGEVIQAMAQEGQGGGQQ